MVTTAGMTAARMSATLKSGAVFTSGVMTCVAYVARSISRLVPVEVRERLRTA